MTRQGATNAKESTEKVGAGLKHRGLELAPAYELPANEDSDVITLRKSTSKRKSKKKKHMSADGSSIARAKHDECGEHSLNTLDKKKKKKKRKSHSSEDNVITNSASTKKDEEHNSLRHHKTKSPRSKAKKVELSKSTERITQKLLPNGNPTPIVAPVKKRSSRKTKTKTKLIKARTETLKEHKHRRSKRKSLRSTKMKSSNCGSGRLQLAPGQSEEEIDRNEDNDQPGAFRVQIEDDGWDDVSDQPGAYNVLGLSSARSTEIAIEEGTSNSTGSNDVEEGTGLMEFGSSSTANPEEPLAAMVVRSESDVAEETKQKLMEEAQMAEIIPPEKFWSLKNRKVMMIIMVAITAIIVTATVVAAVLRNPDDGSDEPLISPELIEVLTPVTGEELLLDASTPHYETAVWLAMNDTAKLDPTNESLEDEIRQRYVIALMYFIFNGEGWSNQLSFLTDSSVCEWHDANMEAGIFCNGTSVAKLKLGKCPTRSN